MIALAVTDTHALIWYARKRWRKLGRRARATFASAEAGRSVIYVPTLVLVELLEAARRGTIELRGGARAWAEALLSSGGFFAADLTPEIVYRAEELYGIPERSDRLIAATAAELQAPLITRDPNIGDVAAVEIIW